MQGSYTGLVGDCAHWSFVALADAESPGESGDSDVPLGFLEPGCWSVVMLRAQLR